MNEKERNIKRERFFNHLSAIMTKDENNELINLTEIYENHGRPRFKSPKRILHHPRGKAIIQHEIERNNNEIEKVIRYTDTEVYGNFNLAIHYIREIDAYNYFLFTDFLMRSEPDIVEKFFNT